MAITPDLTDRIALVTGASRGIGRAVALVLAEAGADVAVNYRERVSEAAEVVALIRAAGRQAIAVGADVSDSGAVAAMMRKVEADLGAVDVLVNNAGIAIIRGVGELTETEFDLTLAVNLKSAFPVRRRWCRVCARGIGDALSMSRRVPRVAPAVSAFTTTHRRRGWRVSPVAMRRGW